MQHTAVFVIYVTRKWIEKRLKGWNYIKIKSYKMKILDQKYIKMLAME